MAIVFPNRASLESLQVKALRELIRQLRESNAFYGKRLKEAGITPEISGLREFSDRMPYTTKLELVEDQEAHPPYGTNLTFPIGRYTRFNQTSATTGRPMRWLDTPESWDWMLGNWRVVFDNAGVTPRDHVLFSFSFGPFLGFWTAFESALQIGCLCLPGGGLSSQARLAILLENEVTVLCCTPTYAIRLAEVALAEGIDLSRSKVRCIIVAGEPGGSIPATRARISKLWNGAKVYDHHGMTEVGPVSFECPVQAGTLHIIESSYYAEVIDPRTGDRAEPYGTGELVLTTLGRTGMPLLRYRTGDLVVLSPDAPCSCGRFDMALPGGILARTDDMVVVRGVNIFPSAIEDVIRKCEGLAEYRVKIRSERAMTELEIEIEPVESCANSAALAAQLEQDMRNRFALRIPVTVVPSGTLQRYEMKAKRWVKA